MLSTVQARLRGLWNRRYFLVSRLIRPEVPVHCLSWLPDGFRIQPVGRSGACVTDGFCASGEAEQIKSGLTDSVDALVQRAAMLIGGTASHLDEVSLLHVHAGGEQELRQLVGSAKTGVRNSGVWVCLDAESGGARLTLRAGGQNIEIQSRTGRAVSWFLGSGQGKGVAESSLQADPGDSPSSQDYWILKLWFCEAPVRSGAMVAGDPRQARMGVALNGSEALPDGIWAPGQDHLESVFGKPDQITAAVRRG